MVYKYVFQLIMKEIQRLNNYLSFKRHTIFRDLQNLNSGAIISGNRVTPSSVKHIAIPAYGFKAD